MKRVINHFRKQETTKNVLKSILILTLLLILVHIILFIVIYLEDKVPTKIEYAGPYGIADDYSKLNEYANLAKTMDIVDVCRNYIMFFVRWIIIIYGLAKIILTKSKVLPRLLLIIKYMLIIAIIGGSLFIINPLLSIINGVEVHKWHNFSLDKKIHIIKK